MKWLPVSVPCDWCKHFLLNVSWLYLLVLIWNFYTCFSGYGMHAGPSPPRRAEASKFDDDVSPRYTHGYQGGGRGGARFREGPPPYGRGRSYGRGYGAPHGKDL